MWLSTCMYRFENILNKDLNLQINIKQINMHTKQKYYVNAT